ncbi:MAG: S8 family serine peptidase [Phycisphaerae bacterium]|nr:S8 family serine peptidase [Phycisphaerae bacterium]
MYRKSLFLPLIPALLLAMLTLPAVAQNLDEQQADPVGFTANAVLVRTQLGVSIFEDQGVVTSDNAPLAEALASVAPLSVEEIVGADHTARQVNRLFKLTLPEGMPVLEVVAILSRLEAVIYAQPSYLFELCKLPNDASFDLQWGLQKTVCPMAWDIFSGIDSVVVAVLDSGVDYTHDDLVGNMWVNVNEAPGNGIDDDHNGYIDDVYGCNTYLGSGDPQETLPQSLLDHGHGTHVAGIIGAVANNEKVGTNMTGVMWNGRIMAVNVVHPGMIVREEFEDPNDPNSAIYVGYTVAMLPTEDIVEGIVYAVDNGAEVVNMSLGSNLPDTSVLGAVDYALDRDVVMVAAAGNEFRTDPDQLDIPQGLLYWYGTAYPAAFDGVIAVGATDPADQRVPATNSGSWVDLMAPGEDILSTLPNQSYAFWTGTSMAAPHVAGAAGLVLGYGRSMSPPKYFSRKQIEEILKSSADNIDAENPGYAGSLGAGRLNVHRALEYAEVTPASLAAVTIELASGTEEGIEVDEHSSARFKATGHRADGTTVDLTQDVTWLVRPLRYGTFDTRTAGKFNASLVPADREVTVTVYYEENDTQYKADEVIVVRNDPDVAPLAIQGGNQIDPGSSVQYEAVFMEPDGTTRNYTRDVIWEILEGRDYARFDTGRPGTLMVDADATEKTLTIRATLVNDEDQIAYQRTKQIQTSASSRQIAGLLVTGPRRVVAGSVIQLRAILNFTGSQTEPEDVTSLSVWSATPSEAGEMLAPGRFMAGSVVTETTATLTAQYSINGQVYRAPLAISVIPAVAMAETVEPNTPAVPKDPNESEPTDELIPGATCPVTGLLTILAVIGGALLCGYRPLRAH